MSGLARVYSLSGTVPPQFSHDVSAGPITVHCTSGSIVATLTNADGTVVSHASISENGHAVLAGTPQQPCMLVIVSESGKPGSFVAEVPVSPVGDTHTATGATASASSFARSTFAGPVKSVSGQHNLLPRTEKSNSAVQLRKNEDRSFTVSDEIVIDCVSGAIKVTCKVGGKEVSTELTAQDKPKRFSCDDGSILTIANAKSNASNFTISGSFSL